MIAIDKMNLGSPPAGFTFARTGRGTDGQWRVVADPSASAGRVIEQTSTDRTDFRFPLAIPENLSAAISMLELAEVAIVKKKIDATSVERIRAEAIDGIRADQLRKLAENKAKHVLLRKALEKSEGDLPRCAEICGMSPRSLQNKLAEYQFSPAAFRKNVKEEPGAPAPEEFE